MNERDPAARRGLVLWIVFVLVIFGLPCAGCTSLAVWHLPELRDLGRMPVARLVDEKAVPSGAHVDAQGDFVEVATVKDLARGTSLWAPAGETSSTARVLVFVGPGEKAPANGHVFGEVCDERFSSPCQIDVSVSSYLSDQRRHGVRTDAPVRILVSGGGRGAALFGIVVTFGAGLLLAGLGLFMLVLPTRRVKTSSVVVEHVWTTPLPPDAVHGALANLGTSDELRVARVEPRRLVFFQGRSRYQARLLGLRTPEAIPRVAEIAWEAGGAYEPTRVQVRVSDLSPFKAKPGQPLAYLLRGGVDRTLSQLAAVLGVQPR